MSTPYQAIGNTMSSVYNFSNPNIPELRHCHLLTWPNYEGFGFSVLQSGDGCYVKDVEAGSPAQLGGIKFNDRILELNGKRIKGYRDRNYVMKEINKYKTLSQTRLGPKTYLNVLVIDEASYEKLKKNKRKLKSTNTKLNIRDIYTPDQSPSSLIDKDDLIIKYVTVYRANDSRPLGFEITKRNNYPHYVSHVEPNSIASHSGISLDDYLIELNDRNIERDANDELRQKITNAMKPENGGKFSMTLLNRKAYEHCVQNNLEFSDFVRNNRSKMKYYETPADMRYQIRSVTPITVPVVPTKPILPPTVNDAILKPILKPTDYTRDIYDKNVKYADDVIYETRTYSRAFISPLYEPINYDIIPVRSNHNGHSHHRNSFNDFDFSDDRYLINDYDTRSLGHNNSYYYNDRNDFRPSSSYTNINYVNDDPYIKVNSTSNRNPNDDHGLSVYSRSAVDIYKYF
jgi:hypothetical protein